MLELYMPQVVIILYLLLERFENACSEGLQIVDLTMPSDSRKVSLELPCLLPVHTVFRASDTDVLHRVWPLSGCGIKGTHGFQNHRK